MARDYKLYLALELPPQLYDALDMIRQGIHDRNGPLYYRGIHNFLRAIERILNESEDEFYYLNDILAATKVLCAIRSTDQYMELMLKYYPNMLYEYKRLLRDVKKYVRLFLDLAMKLTEHYYIYGLCASEQENYQFIAFMLGQRDELLFTAIMHVQRPDTQQN